MADRKNIKVLILADGMPSGGTERQIVELLKGLKFYGEGISTAFGVLVKGGAREREACQWADEVLPIRQTHQLDITLAWSLVRFVKKYDIDIIHTFGSISDLAGVAAAKTGSAFLVNGSIRNARSRLTMRDRISKFALRFADAIVANSEAGLFAYGVKNSQKARVIYNGMNLSRFENVESENARYPYICMVGNFTPKKDHRSLILAFSEIRKIFPDLHLVLVGRGEKERECSSLVEKKDLADSVHIINDCDKPERIIKSAVLCVLLSTDGEGLSNVIMEYCALAKPVVATDRGGNREIINNGVSGILLRSHASEEICSIVVELLRNPGKMKNMGDAGKKILEERFSIVKMVNAYSALYRSFKTTLNP